MGQQRADTLPTHGIAGWYGQGAHLLAVVCGTDLTRPPAESLAVIVVSGATPSVWVVGYLDPAGHRAVASPRIPFNEVRVPVGNLLGQPGQGAAICAPAYARTGALIGAACRGEMRAAFELAFESAKNDRRAGNVSVSEHQNLGYMLADSKMRIEAARYLTWKACHYLDTTERAGTELASISKVRAAELWVQVAHDPTRAVGVDSYPSRSPLAGLRQDA